jgi:hypothetical protein
MKAVCKCWRVSWKWGQYVQERNFSADWDNMFIRKLVSTYKATHSQPQKTINWTPPSKASNNINKFFKNPSCRCCFVFLSHKKSGTIFTSFHSVFQQFNATSPKLLHWYLASRLISWLWIWNMKLLRLPIRLEAIALTIVVYRYLFPLSMSGLRLWLTTRLLFIRVWKASQYTPNPPMVWGS